MNYSKLNFGSKNLILPHSFTKIEVDDIIINTTFTLNAPLNLDTLTVTEGITGEDLTVTEGITGKYMALKDITVAELLTINTYINLYNVDNELYWGAKKVMIYDREYAYITYSGKFATTTGSQTNIFKNLLKLTTAAININDNRVYTNLLTEFSSDGDNLTLDINSGSGSNLYDTGYINVESGKKYRIHLDIAYSSPNVDDAARTSHIFTLRNVNGTIYKTIENLQFHDQQQVNISWNTVFTSSTDKLFLVWNYPALIQDYWNDSFTFSLLIEEY